MLLQDKTMVPPGEGTGRGLGEDRRAGNILLLDFWELVTRDCSVCENTLSCTFMILHWSVYMLCSASIKFFFLIQ